MNIAGILIQQARQRPDAPAIIDRHRGRDRITTFAELETASARGAALLKAGGLSAGDSALVFQPMSAELYIALLALFRLGAVAMFIDPSAGREHMERCCTINSPAAMIASPKAHLLRLLSRSLRNIPQKYSFGGWLPGTRSWQQSLRHEPLSGIVPCTDEDPALLTFTSGSTGMPKAAVRSHVFLLEQHRVLEHAIHLTPGTIDLTTLPVFVLANLASGVTSLIPDADLRRPGSIKPQPVLEQIRRFHPGSTAASPAFLEQICQGIKLSGKPIAGFRRVFTGGAPVFPDRLKSLEHCFPGAEIVAVYGSTEAEPIAHIDSRDISEHDLKSMAAGAGLLAGVPVDEISIRIIDAQWGKPLKAMDDRKLAEISLLIGQTGEIVVSGAHVLKGYLHGAGDEETKFRAGGDIWHRTGDSGYFDIHGRLWLMGRASAVIHDNRGTIFPFAVECAAGSQPHVYRSALLGHAGRRILFVQPDRGARIDMQNLEEKLAWAMIDEFRLTREIPVDHRHNAKVDYTRLTRLI